ncbi:prokineticin-1 isoform X4 [Grus americana]|uniref:prokineticin-1 isoform X4 n=1 Tax=Grus americana TaxID=9117 RepID=UPI0024084D1F|nr:prokineticin-1 isoform X4 [Grus americana]
MRQQVRNGSSSVGTSQLSPTDATVGGGGRKKAHGGGAARGYIGREVRGCCRPRRAGRRLLPRHHGPAAANPLCAPAHHLLPLRRHHRVKSLFINHDNTFAPRLPVCLLDFPSRWEACERDLQCGSGTCCAISLWLRGLRMCTPLGQEGDECHPFSHKVPFFGKRQHHTCPCLPNFICSRFLDGRYRCSIDFKNIDF